MVLRYEMHLIKEKLHEIYRGQEFALYLIIHISRGISGGMAQRNAYNTLDKPSKEKIKELTVLAAAAVRDCPPGQPKPVDKEYRPEKAGSTVVFQVQENDSTRFEDGGGFKRIYKGSTTVKQQEQSYELYEARQHEIGDREVWVSKVRWNWWEGTSRFIVVQYPEHVFVVVAGREEASAAVKDAEGGGRNQSEGSGANQPKAPRSMIQQGLLN